MQDKNTSQEMLENLSELHLDPDKEISEELSNFEIVDFKPADYYRPKPTSTKSLPKNYDKKRKRRRQIQKKSRKTNRK